MKKVIIILVSAVLIIPNLMLTGCQSEEEFINSDKQKIENIQLPTEKDDLIDIKLYFDASKDGKKEKIGKEERIIDKEEVLGDLIIRELIKGPAIKSEFRPIIPKETRLLSFSIKDGVAIVNFSKEAKISMPKVKEKACLVSIYRSLEQLPSVESIQILVDNKNINSLGGNYDISKPFNESQITLLNE